MLFNDRHDAGKQLASRLGKYKGQKDVVILGLARGGVVVAYEVAESLQLPLNVLVVRKIGAPNNEELALGAITESGEGIFNDHLISLLGVSPDYLKKEIEHQKKIALDRLALYRGKKIEPLMKEQTVILVDDGIATGASMRVAIKAMKTQGAKKIVLAVPVGAPDSLKKMEKEVNEIVCLSSPIFFEAVGAFYRVFDQTSDDEVLKLMEKSKYSLGKDRY